MTQRNAWKAEGQYATVVGPFKFLQQIPTNELKLLLENAERCGFGNNPHARAYRAELASRTVYDYPRKYPTA